MQGCKDIQPKMLYQVNLDTLVPADNFYRKLAQTLDLHFLYKATARYYGTEGQERIDPVVFFKMPPTKHVLCFFKDLVLQPQKTDEVQSPEIRNRTESLAENYGYGRKFFAFDKATFSNSHTLIVSP